ncbi:NAD(P)-dependent dehydrogenase, short-chain alcohol dehydrogenase family [Vibrio xiamenensis]|uniref:NAD(P)-dependent dehydrogenase, short-chain alcohol dehydrogenase family n=1 Tax=Vibrio xiamenensis TaxID=861298 RepID=A0A1G8F8M6_9VIBR|nr:SDR family oxidoreductase [Vibrio xiamenensis]SDH78450.1 NAD(P)-dependent dehydrogenase, short-chain alcohol dehydrogenase family [Vibrio xiamenensis]
MDIKYAVILITSAGSRFGATLAMHFINLGARVVLCDKDAQRLHTTYQCCRAISDRVYQYPLVDHSGDAINQLFDDIEHDLQQAPDVLINHFTPSAIPSLMDDHSADTAGQSMSSLASMLFRYSQATAERLRKHHRQGVIVNVISQDNAPNVAGFENAASVVSGFTQSWGKELNPFNIRVGAVIPSYDDSLEELRWVELQDELIRNIEYIVSNDYFSGRVMAA